MRRLGKGDDDKSRLWKIVLISAAVVMLLVVLYLWLW